MTAANPAETPVLDRPSKTAGMPGERADYHTGERDLMLGMIVGCVMAFSALALGIILSLT